MYRILLILYIIWGGVSIASGQDFNYSFTQLSTNQGLSQASVTSVTMDQKGRLWIGTQSGLNYKPSFTMKVIPYPYLTITSIT